MFRRSVVAGLLGTLGLMAPAADLAAGMKAPEFEALDQNGSTVKLADYRGKANVVLYFYPKDDTPGCTAEACSLAKGYREIQATGAVVLGVSADDVVSHKAFAGKYELPFSLLADPDGTLINQYGVKMPLLKMASRVTFIIDKQGVIRFKVAKVRTKTHDQQVLELLKTL
ncbi:MAG: peroxiredoxin [Holophaga sp.]|nr:peroxiredoxin [Holophaga sp.]